MTARDKLVLGTIDLMQRRGVAASGVAEILDHSDVSRRSIYLNFPGGKPELVAEATRVAGAWITAQIRQSCELGDPVAALHEFVSHWKALLTGSEFDAGCPVVAAGMARTVAPEAADVAGETFEVWCDILQRALAERGVATRRARSLAATIVAAVEGAVVMGVSQRSVGALDDVASELTILVEHALGAGPN